MSTNTPKKKGKRLFEKSLKKTVYHVRARNWRKVIALALVLGILCGAFFTVWQMYQNYAVSYAQISLVYPKIAAGKYPDGSRFTSYDLISEERIQEALSAMQAKGKYQNFTAEQLAKQFDIYTYVEGSVAEDVSTLRSEGLNYSYFANEYRLTFTQPHDYDADLVKERIFTPDYSIEFLEELMQAELKRVKEYYGGSDGFAEMTVLNGVDKLDYSEQVRAYKTQINIITRYLNSLNNNSGGFVSEKTGKTLMDLISHYEVLYGERLNQIDNFIESSGVTSDLETLLNKLNIRVVNTELLYNKYLDRVEINRYAKDTYDHTFTENLIIVATSDDTGLYQARPKTAFDTVIDQYNDSVNESIEYKASINELNDQIRLFSTVQRQTAEYARLEEKCIELLNSFKQDYLALSAVATDTVGEYLSHMNEAYITYKVDESSSLNTALLAKACIVMILVAVCVFVFYVGSTMISDRRKLNKKRRILKRLRQHKKTENAAE